MLNLFSDVKKKPVGIYNFNETENVSDLHMPTCLKSMNNPLSGSKAVKGMETYNQLETRMDTLLQNYKVQTTKIILEVTKFELEEKKKKLISAMNYCVSVLANTPAIVNLDTTKWLTTLERKEIAAHAALKMYKTLLNDNFFTLLTAERDDVIVSFKLEHMKDGIREISELPDDQEYEYAQLIQKISLSLTNTLPSLTLQVWVGKVKK